MMGLSAVFVRRVWALFMFAGSIGCVFAWARRRTVERQVLFCVLAVLLFGFTYAASPFFHERPDRTAFVHYRHWAFILPMVTLMAIAGLSRFRYALAPLLLHGLLCAIGAGLLFAAGKSDERTFKETGYVLAIKFGHDPGRLSSLARNYPEAEADLFRGAGWGSAEILLAFHEPTQRDLDTLAALMSRYSARERPWFREGLALALSRDVMRHLRPDFREQVREMIPTPNKADRP